MIENCPVTGIIKETVDFERFRIAGVETASGVIKTGCVVNAAGVWGNKIAQMVELELPLVPMKHAYIVMNSIPKFKNTPNIRDHDASICYGIRGDTVCLGGYEANPEFIRDVSIHR